MRIVFIVLLLSILLPELSGVTVETASLREFLYGSAFECTYDNWLSRVAEGIARPDYNIYSPWERQTNGFGEFRIPDEIELLQWDSLYAAYLSGNLLDAEVLIDSFGFPYEVVDFTDTESGRNFYILRENVDYDYFDDNGTQEEYDDESGAFGYGWGLYIYSPEAEYPVIISVPHPNDDFITVPIALDCLIEWDAMFLFISGAGREVEWTEVGAYNNGKSISDPTRNDDHPLVVACRAATDFIRGSYRREFSAQIHSYDWNRHVNHANCQVSAVHPNPGLPIRDLSSLHYDLINQGDYLMIEAGEYGNEQDCYINDYYSVYYNIYPFNFYSEEDTLMVNFIVDLPGVGGAFLDFATEGWNTYDVYDPFFHMEMDELPNEYYQTLENYYYFYGYNTQTAIWEFEQRYELARAWYSRWVTDLGNILPDVLELDDGLTTTAVENIWFNNHELNSFSVNWLPEPCFDFYSYRIYYDVNPINPGSSPYLDRDTNSILASSLANEITIGGLEIDTGYYIQIASYDYNENVSYSQPHYEFTSPAAIGEIYAIGIDDYCKLFWEAEQQSGNRGFNVYRRTMPGGAYILHDSWQTNNTLVSSNINGEDFEYTDEEVELLGWYRYKLAAENFSGEEFYFDQEVSAKVRSEYSITFQNNEISDTLRISYNEFASDSYDPYFDIATTSYMNEELYTRLFQPDWNHSWYEREVKGYFDHNSSWKIWQIEIRSHFAAGEALEVILDEDCPQDISFHLEDINSEELYYLNDDILDQVLLDSTGSASLWLYVGNVQPTIEFTAQENAIYQAGQQITTLLELQLHQLIYSASLSLNNGSEEIVVIEDLGDISDSLVWIAPDNISIHNADIVINYSNEAGDNFTATSGYKIGVVPAEFSYILPAGWHNIASVWQEEELAVENIFGEFAAMYEWQDSQYTPTDSLLFGKGYWLESDEDCQYSGEAAILNGNFEKLLEPGWNLLPNPHLAPLMVNGLRFQYSNWNYTFYQMVLLRSISRQVYVYRNGIYTAVQQVEPGESFYLYNFGDDFFAVTAIIGPYSNGNSPPQAIADWEVNVMLSQTGDNSEISMGSVSTSTSGFDARYDFPALPAKPEGHGCQLYLSVMNMTYPTSRFRTLFCEPFSPEGERIFEFTARGNPDEPLSLSFDLSEISLDYYVFFELDSEIYDLDLGTDYLFEPGINGSRSGDIHVIYPRVWDYGNVDKNDGVSAYDAAIVLQYSVGLEPLTAPLPWEEWRIITADVDGNFQVESYDASLILQYCIEVIDEFPVQQRNNYPSAPITNLLITQEEDYISLYSQGDLFSFNLKIPAIIQAAEMYLQQVLWADNDREDYRLAIASAKEISAGTLVARLKTKRPLLSEEITLSVNSREMEARVENEEVPVITQLYPVAPNPVDLSQDQRRAVKFSFALAEPGQVKLNIYNIKGQKVRKITSQLYNAGWHEIYWQADDDRGRLVCSGIYLLSMECPGFSRQKKFIVIK